MNSTAISFFALAGFLAPSAGWAFDYATDCGQTVQRFDYHRVPVVRWECHEGDYDVSRAEQREFNDWTVLNNALHVQVTSDISFTVEHSGFDAHYAAEAKKERNADRDQLEPSEHCGFIFTLITGHAALIPGIQRYAYGSASNMSVAPANEFVSKVKSIVCAYDEKREHQVTLENGKLTIYVGKGSNEGGWIEPKIRALKVGKAPAFPEYLKWFKEYGS